MILLLLASLAATVGSGLALYGADEGAGPLGAWLGTPAAGAQPAVERKPAAEHEDEGEGEESPMVEALEEVHEVLATLSLVLVVFHVAGVALASWVHRENLVAAMLSGRKRP